MEVLRLLRELEKLIENQKTFVGVTYDYHPDALLALTNKIRAAIPELLHSEQVMERTTIVLARHLRSPEEVAAVMREVRAEVLVWAGEFNDGRGSDERRDAGDGQNAGGEKP